MNKIAIRKFNQQKVNIISYDEESDTYYCSYENRNGQEIVNAYFSGEELIVSELAKTIYD